MNVFISQPMSGLTEEQILINRINAVARLKDHLKSAPEVWIKDHIAFSDIFTCRVIDNIHQDIQPNPLYYLANDIRMLADADLVFCIKGWENARGCRVEHFICRQYNKPMITEDDDDMIHYIFGKENSSS